MKVAIIPMRSGSKGLIDKNINTFNFKPLFYWTLLKLKSLITTGDLDQVIVSSDDDDYLNRVNSLFNFPKLKLSKRPEILALSDTTTEDVVSHELKKANIDKGSVSIIEVTSPLIPFLKLKEMINVNLCSMDSQNKNVYFPYFSSFLLCSVSSQYWRKFNNFSFLKMYEKRLMRQSKEHLIYKEVGAWSISIGRFIVQKTRIYSDSKIIKIPSEFGVSINDKYDFEKAEDIFRVKESEILEGLNNE